MTTTEQNTTADIKVGGVTRTVAFTYTADTDGTPAGKTWIGGVVSQIGRGAARYPDTMTLWPVGVDYPLYRGNPTTTAADGTVWQYHYATTVRNRSARIIAWETEAARTNEVNQTRR